MPKTFSLTDSPPSINYIEINVDRTDGQNTTVSNTNWETLKQSGDTFLGNRKYLIIVNARVGSATDDGTGANNQLFSFRVTQDHDGSELTPTMTREPQKYNIPHSYCAAEIFTPSVDTKVNFQGKSHHLSYKARLYYLRIVALDITDLREGIDYFRSVDTTADEHDDTLDARNDYELEDTNFTQGLGTWIVFNTALIDVDTDGGDSHGMTTENGPGVLSLGLTAYTLTDRHTLQEEGEDTDERAVLFSAYPVLVNNLSSAIAWKFTILTGDPVGSSDPNEYISSTIIGLNISRFKDVKFKWAATEVATTVGSEITIETWTDQPSNDGKALIIACGAYDVGATARNYWTGLDQDDVDVFDMGTGSGANTQAVAGRSSDGTDESHFVALGLVDLDSSATHEYKWQFKKYTTASTAYEELGYAMFSLTYDYEDFYDEKVEIVKIGEVRRRRSSPTIPTIG